MTATQNRYGFHLREYVRVIFNHIWLVLIFFIAVFFAVWLTSRNKQIRYVARGQIELRANQNLTITPQDLFEMNRLTRFMEFNTLLKLIQSPSVARKVLATLEDDVKLAIWGRTSNLDPGSLSGMVAVERVEATNLVNISIRGRDPVAITRLLNRLIEVYRDYTDERLKSKEERIRDKLLEHRLQADKEVRENYDQVRDYRRRYPDVMMFDRLQEIYTEQMKTLRKSSTETMIEIAKLVPQVRDIQSAKSYSQRLQLPHVLGSPEVRAILKEGETLRNRLTTLILEGKRDEHVDVKNIKRAIDDNQTHLKETVDQILISTQRRFDNLHEIRGSLSQSLQDADQSFKVRSQTWSDYQQLQRRLEKSEEKLKELVENIARSYQVSSLRQENVSIIDRAEVPSIPEGPRKGFNYIFALIAGLGGGIGLAFLLEYLDDTVKTEEDLESHLQVSMLGFIPFIRGEREYPELKDLVTHREPKSAVAESFRTIRTRLLFCLQKLRDDGNQLGAAVVVTSSRPREGKTTASANLAITLAHSGSRCVLVDADLRKPRVHKSFDLKNNVGLTNYLAGAMTSTDILQPSRVKNLWAITSGPLPPNPYELLGSKKMRELIAELRQRFDVIVFDTPPLIFVPDASVLACHVDGVIQLVSAYITRRKFVQMGKERVEGIGGRMLGVILNNADPAKTDYYYYYYYYPGYYKYYSRYYSSDERTESGTRTRTTRINSTRGVNTTTGGTGTTQGPPDG